MKQNMEETVKSFERNTITFSLERMGSKYHATTRFGGVPDVPVDFQWPQYTDEELDETYSIDFVAQFNCEELKRFDLEDILPEKGLLSVFYDTEGQPHEGYSDEKGCVRVFWFESVEDLKKAELPKDISIESCSPCFSLKIKNEPSYPSWEDYEILYGKMNKEERMQYCSIIDDLNNSTQMKRIKMLGWADVIQESMIRILQDEYGENSGANKGNDDWILLLQLNSFQNEDFELLFGDCGALFLYIKEKDLKEKKFDKIFTVLQC